MLRPKATFSCRQLPKHSRPNTAHGKLPQKPKPAGQIRQIICSLERNVGDLKQWYEGSDRPRSTKQKQVRSSTGFRKHNPVMLRKPSVESGEKVRSAGLADVFELRKEYERIHGCSSNNIIELYQLYTHLAGKQEKSTRLMASMEMSNGWSLVGKDSLLKHSHTRPFRKESKEGRKDSLIEEQSESASPAQQSQMQTHPPPKKTSLLANELISRGCYNMPNIANLLSNKCYRLSKEKEKSLKGHHEDKQNAANRANQVQSAVPEAKPEESEPKSPTFQHFPSVSIHKPSQKHSPGSALQRPKRSPQVSGKKTSGAKEKEEDGLSESPIVAKGKQFANSKYYVQPIPVRGEPHSDSLSLECNSRVIDIDCVPFDFE